MLEKLKKKSLEIQPNLKVLTHKNFKFLRVFTRLIVVKINLSNVLVDNLHCLKGLPLEK